MEYFNNDNAVPGFHPDGVYDWMNVRANYLRAKNINFVDTLNMNDNEIINVKNINNGELLDIFRWEKSNSVPPASGELSFIGDIFNVPNPQTVHISKNVQTGADVSNLLLDLDRISVMNYNKAEQYICRVSGIVDNGSYVSYTCLIEDIIGAGSSMDNGNIIGVYVVEQDTTASNVGTAGVGIFKEKIGDDIKLKKINAGSNKITVFDDVANDEVDIDVDPSNININDLGDVVIAAPSGGDILVYDDFSAIWENQAAPAVVTAANIGTAGVGIYKEQVGGEIRLKKVNAGSNKISVVDDVGDDEVDLDVNEANLTIDYSQLTGTQPAPVQHAFDDNAVHSGVDGTGKANGDYMKYNSGSGNWVPITESNVNINVQDQDYNVLVEKYQPSSRFRATQASGVPISSWIGDISGNNEWNVNQGAPATGVAGGGFTAVDLTANDTSVQNNLEGGGAQTGQMSFYAVISDVGYEDVTNSLFNFSTTAGADPTLTNNLTFVIDSAVGGLTDILSEGPAPSLWRFLGSPILPLGSTSRTVLVVVTQSTAPYIRVFVNGSEITPTTNTFTGWTSTVPSNFVSYGCNAFAGTTKCGHMKVYEQGTFNRSLSTAEVADLTNMLNSQFSATAQTVPSEGALIVADGAGAVKNVDGVINSLKDVVISDLRDRHTLKWTDGEGFKNEYGLIGDSSDVSTGGGLGNIIGDRVTYVDASYPFGPIWTNLSLVVGSISFENFASPVSKTPNATPVLVDFPGVLNSGAFQVTTNNLGRLTQADGLTWSFNITFYCALSSSTNNSEWRVRLYIDGSPVGNSYQTAVSSPGRYVSLTGFWTNTLVGTLGTPPNNQYVEIYINQENGTGAQVDVGSAYLSIQAIKLESLV